MRMNKENTTKAVECFEQIAAKYGIETMINVGESPIGEGYAIYIDGELHTEYWGYGFVGWDFQNEVVEELNSRGLWIEPWTETIFEVYESSR